MTAETDTLPVPTKPHLSRWRRRVVFGMLGLVLVAYLGQQLGLRLPAPTRSEANAHLVAEVEGRGGFTSSTGFRGGFLGLGLREEISVHFMNGNLGDDEWRRVAELATDDVVKIVLHDAKLSDEGLKLLAKFRGLHSLVLSYTKPATTDAQRPRLIDSSLASLRELEKLEILVLDGAEITGIGFDHLKGWRHLRFLSLTRSDVSDEGMDHLASAFPTLDSIVLSHTNITDAGVKPLARMKVANLWLSYNYRLTRVALKDLEAIGSLRRLSTVGDRFVASDFARLRLANPRLRVELSRVEVLHPLNPRP